MYPLRESGLFFNIPVKIFLVHQSKHKTLNDKFASFVLVYDQSLALKKRNEKKMLQKLNVDDEKQKKDKSFL